MNEVFPIIPASIRAGWLAIPVVLLAVTTVGIGWMMLRVAQGMRSTTFTVEPGGIRIAGDLYGRFVPAAALRADLARPINLANEPDLAPKWRTGGTAVPGYRAGWFRLSNGDKALIYVTDPGHVAYIPTTEGYALMLSTPDPERLIESVRRIAPSP